MLVTGGTLGDDVAWRDVNELARLESRWFALRLSMWIGWALTVVEASLQTPEWAGGSYELKIPISFSLMILGVYVAAVRTGNRDRMGELPPLAIGAPLDDDDRYAARLMSLVVPVGLALMTTVVFAVVARVEGGYWIGDFPRRTDTANHSVLELLQPALLVALFGAIGVVLGRRIGHAMVAMILGFVVWMALFPMYWAWNSPPLHVFAPLQSMPMRVNLPQYSAIADTPTNWWVETPGQYDPEFRRSIVHLPTVAFHNLYLIGLTMLVGAAVARRHRRTVRVGGAVLAFAAVVAQLVVSPY
jgi:hypothetical protein